LNYDAKVGLEKSQKKQKTGELNKHKGELNRKKTSGIINKKTALTVQEILQ